MVLQAIFIKDKKYVYRLLIYFYYSNTSSYFIRPLNLVVLCHLCNVILAYSISNIKLLISTNSIYKVNIPYIVVLNITDVIIWGTVQVCAH